VEATPAATRYTLIEGEALELFHFAEAITVSMSESVLCQRSDDEMLTPTLIPASQPAGRAPVHREPRVSRDLEAST
jgi:hypothetical protein